jgi:ferredoxin
MSPIDLMYEVLCTALRFLPWPTTTGLFAVGQPHRASPVILTGNYQLTVRRVRRAVRGRHLWLLVANSRGINVWCASSGGHLTTHDVISALRTSGISEKVDHRRFVLPLLSATGVETRIIAERTGWQANFGPALAKDLPAYLDKGMVPRAMRRVPFPLANRLEVSLFWAVPAALILSGLGWWAAGPGAALTIAFPAMLVSLAAYALLPYLRPYGAQRVWIALVAAASFCILAESVWTSVRSFTPGSLVVFSFLGLMLGGVLVIDIAGTTPTLNSPHLKFSTEVVPERCTGAAACIQVCPRQILEMHERKAQLEHPEECIRCGACVVQCPEDAIRFRLDNGTVVEAATVRRTKLNLLGERCITVPNPKADRNCRTRGSHA